MWSTYKKCCLTACLQWVSGSLLNDYLGTVDSKGIWDNTKTIKGVIKCHMNNQGVIKNIDEEDNNSGIRYLGIQICPSGNTDKEYKYRMQEAKKISNCIKLSALSRQEVRILHDCMWIPSISYCLMISTFSEVECNNIERVYMSKVLSRMGYNRNASRKLVYAPKETGGL